MSVYDFSYRAISGEEVKMSDYSGKVLLLVNSASKCGFTPQYEGLQKLYETYEKQGLIIIAFPCNQFGKQEPGSQEQIGEFCKVRYGVTFPLSEKIDVNGAGALPLFDFLKSQKPFETFGKGAKGKMMAMMTKAKAGQGEIKWNFTKFLIDKEGNVVNRYEPTLGLEPVELDIKKLLKI
jgi:glutathione peroxidase